MWYTQKQWKSLNEKYTDQKTFINNRMGGFQAASIFLGAIWKRLKDAGLKDFLIELQILREDQVDQMLKVKEYNNGMHKKWSFPFRISLVSVTKSVHTFLLC